MNRRLKTILRALAILLVIVAVLMEIQVMIVPALGIYKFWMVVTGFAIWMVTG